MASLGSALLALAFLAAVFAAVAWRLPAATATRRWVRLSRRAVYALLRACSPSASSSSRSPSPATTSPSTSSPQHSSIETPTFYKLAAMWSSQEGSLLLWAWVLSIASSAALYATRNKLREIVP